MKKILAVLVAVVAVATMSSCNDKVEEQTQKEYVVGRYDGYSYDISLLITNGLGDTQTVEGDIYEYDIFQMMDTTTLINYIKEGIKYFSKDTLQYKMDGICIWVSNECYVAPELLKELVDKVHKKELSKKSADMQYRLNKLSERPDMLIWYRVFVKNENSIFVEKNIKLHILLDNNNYITEEEIENMEEELKWYK